MTQNEIIEITKEARIKRRTDEFYSEFCDGIYFDDLESFAKLIAAKEREACALICERVYKRMCPEAQENEIGIEAELIRARGKA